MLAQGKAHYLSERGLDISVAILIEIPSFIEWDGEYTIAILGSVWKLLEHNIEPQIDPDGKARALHGSFAAIGVWLCVWMRGKL